MGYRIYLASITNEKYEKIKYLKSYKEIVDTIETKYNDEEHVGVYELESKCLHEFGKYVDWTDKIKKECTSQFFSDKEFNDLISSDQDFFIINKKGLEFIIEEYNNEMANYYNVQYSLSVISNVLQSSETDLQNWKEEYLEALKVIKEDKICFVYYNLEELFCIDYEHLLSSNNKNKINKIIRFINQKQLSYFQSQKQEFIKFDGSFKKTFNLNEDNHLNITNSWMKDKVVLDLTHLYKVFDWENNKMFIYGY